MSNQTHDPRHTRGRHGESLAAEHLEQKGWHILDRNVDAGFGELDLVITRVEPFGAREIRTVAFVEVKTRRDDTVPPESNITESKRRKIIRLGKWYDMNHDFGEVSYRFDVVTVLLNSDPPDIEHYPAAFDALGRIN